MNSSPPQLKSPSERSPFPLRQSVENGDRQNGKHSKDPLSLTPLEREFIGLFARVATILGIPRSIGEIYGLLYASPRPRPFHDIVARLGISTGSVSKGLRLLRKMGAIRVVYKAGDRRDHYTAEIAVKLLLTGFLREKVEPHLVSGVQSLDFLNETFTQTASIHRGFYRERIDNLMNMHHKANEFLPLLLRSLE